MPQELPFAPEDTIESFLGFGDKIKIKNAPKLTAKLALHPSLKKGFKTLKAKDEFYIQDKLEKNKAYRLMHLFNFKDNELISINPDPSLNASLIHWLPVSKELVNVEVLMDDGSVKKGVAEKTINVLKKDEICQFERNFFVKKPETQIQ